MYFTPGTSAVSAIILAAGMSRRMGAPKQLLRAGDRTLLALTIENVSKSAAREIILVLGFAAAEIQQTISTQGFRVVVNTAFQEGMASSLRAGIAAVDPQAQAALIVLADQPCVLPRTLDQLIEHYQESHPQILIPTYKGFRGNPVLLDRSVFPEVAAITGDVGCRAIFGSHTENIHKLELDDPGILIDVDTNDDFENMVAARGPGRALHSTVSLPDLESRGHGAEAAPAQPELVVMGRDPVGRALIKLGSLLGFTTTVVDPLLRLSEVPEADRALHRLDFSLLPKDSERYIVVASRGQFDEDGVEQALHSNAAYIGLLANHKRAQELAASLQRKGIPTEQLRRLRMSAGLAIGAESPEEIALSIMAEIVAVRRRRESK